jgi:putative endonuclease
MDNAVLAPEKAESTTGRASGRRRPARKTEGKNQQLGKVGEDMACHYLEEKEIVILERNWVCKCGEADIIALEEDTLVFIEVKTRSEGFPGLPEYAVTREKRERYEKIAISYLVQHQRPSGPVRFDVIAVQMTGKQQCLLRHHRDAFSVGE